MCKGTRLTEIKQKREGEKTPPKEKKRGKGKPTVPQRKKEDQLVEKTVERIETNPKFKAATWFEDVTDEESKEELNTSKNR